MMPAKKRPQTLRRYAEDTKVPAEQSRSELEKLLKRYGATKYASGWSHDQREAMIGFEIERRAVRIHLPLPREELFTFDSSGRRRSANDQRAALDQAERAAWRQLLLVVKAKLEAAAAGITTIEEQFFSDLVLPTGQTLYEHHRPDLEKIWERGHLPVLPGEIPGKT